MILQPVSIREAATASIGKRYADGVFERYLIRGMKSSVVRKFALEYERVGSSRTGGIFLELFSNFSDVLFEIVERIQGQRDTRVDLSHNPAFAGHADPFSE